MAKTKTARNDRAAQEVIIGTEPDWTVTHDDIEGSIVRAYNWYHYMSTPKKRKEWLLDYMKAEGFGPDEQKLIKGLNFDSIADWKLKPNVRCFQGRMILNGCPMPEYMRNELNDEIKTLINIARQQKQTRDAAKVEEEKKEARKPTVQERLAEVQSEYIGEVEAEIDRWLDDPSKEPEFSVYEWLNRDENAKPTHARAIAEWLEKNYIPELKEEANAKSGETAYPHLKPAQRRKFYNFVKNIADDARSWADNKTKRRKSRKKKGTPAVRKVRSLKFKENDNDLKIGSVTPSKIVGASQLIAFDVDKRKIKVYNAKDGGFDVKGTTILNFDESKSFQKTVREQYLKDVLSTVSKQGKRAVKKKIDAISAKPQSVKGRTNNNLVLMRVF